VCYNHAGLAAVTIAPGLLVEGLGSVEGEGGMLKLLVFFVCKYCNPLLSLTHICNPQVYYLY